ncbi:aminopeptidase N [Sphingomonas sp. BE138]|uniref:M1 family metallopeptidase n=1 Tax=Sphingomonas sp. BE138 TaxID=2817845 RepID=UPI002860F5F0|nr:M1 family aminopeptidase [Sphingomonas sp. BE138]MDR6786924.1 aminopeptidase N [Sphingomonas sp. BE138]
MKTILLASAALLIATPALARAPAAAPAAIPLGKLSDAARPTAYRLDLTVDPTQTRFTGHTEIDTQVARPTRTLYLHGNGLNVTRVAATIGTRKITARYTQVDPSGVARLDFDGDLPAGRVTLAFDYDAPFMTGGEGLYRTRVGDRWYAWTQFEPIDARRMFPSFDEPGFKTPFTLSITAPTTQRVFANTPEVAHGTSGGGLTVHTFAPSRPLPTYLVAIAVGAFDVVPGNAPANAVRKTALPYRVIATKGQAPRLQLAASEGPKILALHEDYFGIPYPFEKLDQIASPEMSGAMENAGLVTYGDTLLLLSPDAPPSQRRDFGMVVAHELAHQWFGDLVTPKWWTDLWLNESFAEWAGNRVGELWQPGLGTEVGQLAEALAAMDTDSQSVGRPIRQEITRNDQIASAFDAITYQKGGQVLTMVERYLGPDRFRRGVQYHLNRFRYGNAAADDFFASMAKGSGDPGIVPVFRSFVEQTGVPVLSIRQDGDSWHVSQRRYRPIGVAPLAPQTWNVPVCARQGEVRSCTLLTGATGTLALKGSGLAVPNADGAGYWRYSLDDAGWQTLMAGAPSLPAREAMAAADSLWADFTAGNARFARVVDSARLLAGHRERSATLLLPAAIDGVERFDLSPAADRGLRRFAADVSLPRLRTLGPLRLTAGAYAGEESGQSQLRQSLVSYAAFVARDAALRRQLSDAARASVGGDAQALDPGYRAIALLAGVQEVGVPFMDRLRTALIASTDPLFRQQAVRALGGADTPATVARALALSDDVALQPSERLSIMRTLTNRPVGRDAVFARLRQNFDAIAGTVPAFGRPRLPMLFAGYCSADKAAAVEALFRPKLAVLGGGELELGQSLDAIRQCVALKDAKGAEIESVLGKF